MMSVEVIHQGKPVKISRNQNNKNTVKPDYAITSRPCPPFCIRAIKLAPGVETIGELEMLRYLGAASSDPSILVIDSRPRIGSKRTQSCGQSIFPGHC